MRQFEVENSVFIFLPKIKMKMYFCCKDIYCASFEEKRGARGFALGHARSSQIESKGTRGNSEPRLSISLYFCVCVCVFLHQCISLFVPLFLCICLSVFVYSICSGSCQIKPNWIKGNERKARALFSSGLASQKPDFNRTLMSLQSLYEKVTLSNIKDQLWMISQLSKL